MYCNYNDAYSYLLQEEKLSCEYLSNFLVHPNSVHFENWKIPKFWKCFYEIFIVMLF